MAYNKNQPRDARGKWITKEVADFGEFAVEEVQRDMDAIEMEKKIDDIVEKHYEGPLFRGMYDGLFAVGEEICEYIRVHHSMFWLDEPIDGPGDLSETLSFYIIPAPGDEQYMDAEMGARLAAAVNSKVMYIGQVLRYGGDKFHPNATTRLLSESQYYAHHEPSEITSVALTSSVGPVGAQLVIFSPMNYSAYPVNRNVELWDEAFSAAGATFDGLITDAIRKRMYSE